MNSLTNDGFINSVDLLIEKDNSNKNPIDVKASLDDVNERIAMAMSDVEAYSTQLESNNTPPSIKKEWYQFPVVTANELNNVLNNFHGFVYRSFNLVKCVLDTQNENAKSICNLIYLIAAGEAQLYGQLKELTIIDQEDIEKLKILENRFLESLELNEGDKKAAHKQLVRLIDYTQAIENVKTKWIRNLELRINEIYNSIDDNIADAKATLEEIINDDRKEIDTYFRGIKAEVDNRKQELIELKKSIEKQEHELTKLINERLNKQEERLTKQNAEIEKLKRKTFFDSKYYKIAVGVISIIALICSMFLWFKIR